MFVRGGSRACRITPVAGAVTLGGRRLKWTREQPFLAVPVQLAVWVGVAAVARVVVMPLPSVPESRHPRR